MSRRLLAAAALAVALTPLAAQAGSQTIYHPTRGCTYTVYWPDITMGGGVKPGFTMHGGTGYATTC